MTTDWTARLAPVADALTGLDLSDPSAAKALLATRLDGDTMAAITADLLSAHAEGGLTPKDGGPHVRFGRLARPSEASRGFSIDVVDIAGAGAPHTHPEGEVSWCVPLEGAPRFEGVAEGWAVCRPGSRHVPEVTGGRMLIVYWLPQGAVAWG